MHFVMLDCVLPCSHKKTHKSVGLIINTKIGGTWVHPQPLDQIPFLIQGTCNRSVERCDSTHFCNQAWVPPLYSQVRRSGKRLFLALLTLDDQSAVGIIYNIYWFYQKVNLFFNKNVDFLVLITNY